MYEPSICSAHQSLNINKNNDSSIINVLDGFIYNYTHARTHAGIHIHIHARMGKSTHRLYIKPN